MGDRRRRDADADRRGPEDRRSATCPPSRLRVRSRKKKSDDEEDDEEEQQRLLPHAAVTVWEGHLMIASHIDFLLKVIAPAKKPELLERRSGLQTGRRRD